MWQNPQETAVLVAFTDEILNWKLHFLCSVKYGYLYSELLEKMTKNDLWERFQCIGMQIFFPVNIYLFKVNSSNTRRCETQC